MALTAGTAITAADFTALKNRIDAECRKRNGQGSVYSLPDNSAYQYVSSTSPLKDRKVIQEHYSKIVSQVSYIKTLSDTNLPNYKRIDSAALTKVSNEIKALENVAKASSADFAGSTGCKSSCTGLCYTTCTGTCRTTCTGGCSNACTSCTNACTSCTGTCTDVCTSCTGGCTGCGSGCASTCEKTCTGTCYSSCTGTCSSTCTGTCSVTCGQNCSGQCMSDCTHSCGTACSKACGSGCALSCSGSCKGTSVSTCTGCTGTCSGTCFAQNRPVAM